MKINQTDYHVYTVNKQQQINLELLQVQDQVQFLKVELQP